MIYGGPVAISPFIVDRFEDLTPGACIRNVPVSNLGWDTIESEVFHSSTQSVQASAGSVRESRHTYLIPQLFSS